jgi:hypothetical protein
MLGGVEGFLAAAGRGEVRKLRNTVTYLISEPWV